MTTRVLRSLVLAALLLIPCMMMAQKQFTLEDLNFGGKNYRNMIPANRTLMWWGDKLVHAEDDVCTLVDVNTGKEKKLFDLEQLNEWAETKVKSLKRVSFPYEGRNLVLVNSGKDRLLVNFRTHKVEWRGSTADEQTATDFNLASRNVAYVKDDNLYVADAKGNVRQLSKDGSRDIVYGQSVHRNEFGINGGTFWSPDGMKLAFYRMDQSMVADFPLVDIPELDDTTHVMATPAPEKYPFAGQTSHIVTVGVYDVAKDAIVYLKTADPTDRYFTNISWSTDGKIVYVKELNRDQNDMQLIAYCSATGEKIGELYRETHPKYVEPLHPIVFLPWDSTQYVDQSQKDGYNHLYLFDQSGKQLKQITSGKWVVMNVLGFDAKNHSIIYESNEANPIQCNLYRVNVDDGTRVRIDADGLGYHHGNLSKSGAYVVDTYQEPNVPRDIDIVNTELATAMRYFTAEDPWKGYAVPTYNSGTIKAADGVTDLYYRMVLPPDFDANKKYPTIVYVYGGPHAHNVDAGWHYRSRSWETYMAQRGYVLFILDNRGSENRGRDFEQATFRQLGQIEMQDQMKGVEFLRSLAYVDTARMGVHGWSFGGFMTISLMANYPDVFKVGVAGGPVIDWKWYEVMYGERYMDTPQTNPEGYAKSSLIGKSKNIKGRLEIIQGLNDATVVPQNCFSFLKDCVASGYQPDFFVYPGQPHNMKGHQSVHLHERITRYFDDFLKPLR